MKTYIYQLSSQTSGKAAANNGFMHLPPSDRKDWGDYAAIRDYFLRETVDEEALYGFVAADFSERTGLKQPQIEQFFAANPDNDVYNFFPFAQDAACFFNVFEEGEFHHPGLRDIAQSYLDSLGLTLDLREFVTDFRTTARTGYLIARPVFWKTLFDLAEQVYALAENGQGELADQLNRFSAGTGTGTGAGTGTGTGTGAMKSLLTERLASLVLGLDQQLRIALFDHTAMPLQDLAVLAYQDSLPLLDTLKRNYMATGEIEHIDNYLALRNSILQHAEQHAQQQAEQVAISPLSNPAAVKPASTQRDLIYGCITHVELPIRFPDFVTPIYLGESQAEGRLNLRDLAPQWLPYHPIVGGMVGNFALRNYILAHHPEVKRIGVCMYRKFVSRGRISGVPAEENWMMDVISDKELDQYGIDNMLAPGDAPFLIGKTCGFTVYGQSAGYLAHYLHSHHIEDMLRFTSEAVELGVLDKTEVEPFFNEKVFFMGGVELGVFPADFWLKSIGDIEAVAWACVQRYEMHREGYQSRAWAFCAERLGSYLLLRHLRALYPNNSYEQFMGQLNLITRGGQTLYVPSH